MNIKMLYAVHKLNYCILYGNSNPNPNNPNCNPLWLSNVIIAPIDHGFT